MPFETVAAGSGPTTLLVGEWHVDPARLRISRGAEEFRVEARTMRVLVHLAHRAGEVVSIEELLDHAWAGVVVTPDSVYQAVTSLRRVLGDDPKLPRYIATVPRLGYRLVAAVTVEPEVQAVPTPSRPNGGDGPVASAPNVGSPAVVMLDGSAATRSLLGRRRLLMLAGVGAMLVAAAALLIRTNLFVHAGGVDTSPSKSVAVLPFRDLTDAMNEEPFADGMTEELIGKLSNVSELQVPPPTSSFNLEGKHLSVAEVASSLGVAYVLDGSVRKADHTVRVAARLVRASDGFVVWSETYDRPFEDRLKLQSEIASEITKALVPSLDAAAR